MFFFLHSNCFIRCNVNKCLHVWFWVLIPSEVTKYLLIMVIARARPCKSVWSDLDMWCFITLLALIHWDYNDTDYNKRKRSLWMSAGAQTRTAHHQFDLGLHYPHVLENAVSLNHNLIFFLISAGNDMLWVLIKSTSPKHFWWVPTAYVFRHK